MIIVGNTKAFIKNKKEAEALIRLYGQLGKQSKHSFVLALPFPFLSLKKGSGVLHIGAQNVSTLKEGAHTGEVTASIVHDGGAEYCIVGHSETREGETNETIREKITNLLEQKVIPVVCIGESHRTDDGEYLDVLKDQVVSIFSGRTIKEMSTIVIAYEPVWAIGQPTAPSAEHIYETVLFIRKMIQNIEPLAAKKVLVLYGGSVDSLDIESIARDGGVNGFLLGRASVNSEEMKKISEILNEIPR